MREVSKLLSQHLFNIKADLLRRSERDIEKNKEDLLEEIQNILNKIHHTENRTSISKVLTDLYQLQMAKIKKSK